MKTVAVLIPTFTIEYSMEILSGIYDYFSDKDVKVIIAQTKFPHSTTGSFDYQYWTSVEYLKALDVDAYIVVSGVYVSTISISEFEDIVAQLAPRPVISVGVQLSIPGTYTVKADCKKSFSDVIAHLKNVHNCKKIAFCSANSTKSMEALERFEAFTEALKEYNLPFYKDLVLDGYFTDFGAARSFKENFPDKTSVDFDAIVCANDMMAAGCMQVMREYGIRVPEDVKVVGFDDAVVSKLSSPKISSINQSIHLQGEKAAELADKLLQNEEVQKVNLVSLLPKFRQSCSCVDCQNSQAIYKNTEGQNCPDTLIDDVTLQQFLSEIEERNKIITLMDTLKASNTLKQLFFNMSYIADQCNFSSVAINMFEDAEYLEYKDEFRLPEEMEMWVYEDNVAKVNLFRPGIFYNPKETVIASRAMNNSPGIYILHPVFAGELNYGYLLCKTGSKLFADYLVHLKIIVTSIAQSFEYTKKLMEAQKLKLENSGLSLESRTDELTQILNRRGFIEKGQSELDVMQETDKAGVIFFADMDGLKTINDTYGHEMGDLAIKTQAQVLKSVFRCTDVVGRIGGDEFGIVAVGMKINQIESVKLKIDMMNKKLSAQNNLPFTLSISLGGVDLQKSSVLSKLLSEADKSLYSEKRNKRNARLSQNPK